MPGADLQVPPPWEGPSEDPRDEQFGDIVASVSADRADQYAAVLVGEPYDGAVIGERGAAKGPVGLRQALAATKTHHFAAGPIRSVADLGDVTVPDGSPSGVQRHVRETARAVHETSAFPVFLGGDNSLSFANAAPLLAEGSLGVVNLDAHLDCRAVRGEPTSGTPYRQLYEAGMDDYAVVGVRHFETSTAYAEYVAERGGTVVTADEVGTGPTAAAERAREAVADADVIYLSVDLDVLDASVAPGVSAPTPGGLTARELYRLLDTLATDDRLAGFEVMECAPPLDRDRRTAKAGARAVARVLSARFGRGGDD